MLLQGRESINHATISQTQKLLESAITVVRENRAILYIKKHWSTIQASLQRRMGWAFLEYKECVVDDMHQWKYLGLMPCQYISYKCVWSPASENQRYLPSFRELSSKFREGKDTGLPWGKLFALYISSQRNSSDEWGYLLSYRNFGWYVTFPRAGFLFIR